MTDWRLAATAGLLSAAMVAANVLVKPRLSARVAIRPADSVMHGREWRGRPAPALTLVSTTGVSLSTSGEAPRVRLLVFFASWSVQSQMVLAVIHEYATRGTTQGQSLDLLLVNAQESEDLAMSCVDEFAPAPRVALDPTGVAMRAFEVRTIPTIVAIDRDGRVALYHEGSSFSPDVALDPLLQPQAPAPR